MKSEGWSTEKDLVYDLDFKDFIHEHPGVIATFRDLESKVVEHVADSKDKSEYSLESDGMVVTALPIHCHQHRDVPVPYLKVEVGGQAYFVKCVPGYFNSKLGPEEFRSLDKAKAILKDVHNVDVIDFQLGFNDRERNTYFISKWTEGQILNDYFNHLEDEIKDQETSHFDYDLRDKMRAEMAEIKSRFAEVEAYLKEFADVDMTNAFYNPQTKRITIFDVHEMS